MNEIRVLKELLKKDIIKVKWINVIIEITTFFLISNLLKNKTTKETKK